MGAEMKLNLGSVLKSVIVVAAPAAATAILGPVGGVLVGGALGGGAVGKVAGQKVESLTNKPVQKITGPIGAAAVPLILASLLPPADLERICTIVSTACAHPAAAAGWLAGATGLIAHTLGDGTKKSIEGR